MLNNQLFHINVKKKLRFETGKSDLDICLSIKKGSCLGIYGDSGSGKSTLLKIICGFEKPDSGYIKFFNEQWYSSFSKENIKIRNRGIGYAFQKPALFPHMSFYNHLLFTGAEINEIKKIVSKFNLKKLLDHKPEKLSGGQKQKLQYLMLILLKPNLILLDEPFSAMDNDTRKQFEYHFKAYISKNRTTSIIISHNENLLKIVSSNIVKLSNGKIVEQDFLSNKKVINFYN